MKLIKIEDVRVGQVWKDEDGDLFLEWDSAIEPPIRDTIYYETSKRAFEYLLEKGIKLIGFLGITHEIKDNKLVEIPRAEFEVDDVIESFFEDGIREVGISKGVYELFNVKWIKRMIDCDVNVSTSNKIGIYGVTHEFVNERLVK